MLLLPIAVAHKLGFLQNVFWLCDNELDLYSRHYTKRLIVAVWCITIILSSPFLLLSDTVVISDSRDYGKNIPSNSVITVCHEKVRSTFLRTYCGIVYSFVFLFPFLSALVQIAKYYTRDQSFQNRKKTIILSILMLTYNVFTLSPFQIMWVFNAPRPEFQESEQKVSGQEVVVKLFLYFNSFSSLLLYKFFCMTNTNYSLGNEMKLMRVSCSPLAEGKGESRTKEANEDTL